MGFRKIWSAFRVVLSSQWGGIYNNQSNNGDATVDEYGALWVRPVPGSGGGSGSGSLAFSNSFTSNITQDGLKTTYTVRPDSAIGPASLQSVQAHAAEFCYLQMFTHDSVSDGEQPFYEWPVPYPEGVSEEFNYPWGLRVPQGGSGITFCFSSTTSYLTSGPLGMVQGIYTATVVD